jgi:hypothetical protein
MKWFVIPEIVGSTGIVTEGLKSVLKQYEESVQQNCTKKGRARNITHRKESAVVSGAQVVSRRPLAAESRVRARVNPCGICGGQSGTGTGSSPSS